MQSIFNVFIAIAVYSLGIKFTNLQTEDDAKEFFIMAANPEINQEMCILMKRLWEDTVSSCL